MLSSSPELVEKSMEEDPVCALVGGLSGLPMKLNGLLRHHGSKLPKGAEKEIPLIKHDLQEIIAFLHGHISRLEIPSVMLKCWMKEVRELSYDVDDCIDQYKRAADSKSNYVYKVPRRKFTLCKTNHLHKKLKQRLWMANKIREFSVRVQEALQRHEMCKLSGIVHAVTTDAAPAYASFCSPYHAHCEEPANPVGIDAPMNRLEQWLTKDKDEKLKVVAILGVSGIGKTTLANKLYCELGGQFECKAFVRASQKPDMRRLLSSMLSQVRPRQRPHTWKVHNLIAEIRKHLQDKRYLIVVDGVWTTSTWEIVNCVLPDDSRCSRVLITTEIQDVAHKCCGYDSKFIFTMKPLGDDDSRKLFFSIVFDSEQECPSELNELSNNILRKCGGFPLAIVAIANLLASKMNKPEQWDYIHGSLGCGLRTNTTLEGMKQALYLSYTNLPHHLKACMLYLSIYEEDYVIWKDDLVKQWIAEGFICATEEQDRHEVAGSYFDSLVSRRMIQPVHINDNNEVLSCVVHHMVLNLISYESIQENFAISIDHSQTTTRLADKVRRLSLQYSNVEDARLPTNMRLLQVRSLAFFGVFKCMPDISGFQLLQVLVLHFWGDEESISFDVTNISGLFRLRYLQIKCNSTLELQNQVRGLQSLESLKIEARASVVPSDIVHLPRLLHLNLPAQTDLPNGIGYMTALRALGCFDLSSSSVGNVESLGRLTNLRDLQLACSAVQPDNLKNKMQVLCSILGKLRNLNFLTLVHAGSSSYFSTMDVDTTRMSSVSPPVLLQKLEMLPRVCIFFNLPMWIGQLGRLCILKIGVRKLAGSDVNVLGGLPALTVLSLYIHTEPKERIVFDRAGFSVLKYFKFRCSVPLLKFEADSMPELQKLKLGFNACSTTIPVGIKHLSGLKKMCAKIGGVAAEEKRAVELFLREIISMHPGHPTVNIQRVDRVFGGKDDTGSRTEEEERGVTLQRQHEIMEEDGAQVLVPMSPRNSEIQIKMSGLMETVAIASERNTLPEWSRQVRVSTGPDGYHPDDGFSWIKYGQKDIVGAKRPRAYFQCTHKNSHICPATKQVQCRDDDPWLFDVMYQGCHTCAKGAHTQPAQEQSSASLGLKAGRGVQGLEEPTLSVGAKNSIVIASPFTPPWMRMTMTDRLPEAPSIKRATSKWKLAFRNPLRLPIFTGSKIVDASGEALQIILMDMETGSQVAPPQPLRIELVPMFGDFTTDDREDLLVDLFQAGIARERSGKRPLLTGDVVLTMRDGRVAVNELQFTDNSSWVRCRKYRIGARVAPGSLDGARIRKAISEAFTVRDHDGGGELYMNRKHYPPLPGDNVVSKLSENNVVRKRRKTTMRVWRTQVRLSSVQDVTPLDDGFSWRKYGQKDILGAKYPRAYFRCTHRHLQGCRATKQVQRTDIDPQLFDVEYREAHTCRAQSQLDEQRAGGAASAQPGPSCGGSASAGGSEVTYSYGSGTAAGDGDSTGTAEVELASVTNSSGGLDDLDADLLEAQGDTVHSVDDLIEWSVDDLVEWL